MLGLLNDNDVRLVSYVPDNVLTPLTKGATSDNYFMSIGATREDEAIGTVTGAYMAGLRGVVMMQTSGFALLGLFTFVTAWTPGASTTARLSAETSSFKDRDVMSRPILLRRQDLGTLSARGFDRRTLTRPSAP